MFGRIHIGVTITTVKGLSVSRRGTSSNIWSACIVPKPKKLPSLIPPFTKVIIKCAIGNLRQTEQLNQKFPIKLNNHIYVWVRRSCLYRGVGHR
jgi:hypothetical protein